MSTTGHESDIITVEGLKSSLQKLKTDHIDGKANMEVIDHKLVLIGGSSL